MGLLMFAGCGGDRSADESPGGHAEHAAHFIPAHKPKTFPDAVRRLRELNQQIVSVINKEKPGSTSDGKPLQFALDIALWLPEIAADCEMPETPWNEVNARSSALAEDYKGLVAGTAAKPSGVLENADAEIAKLERLLSGADARWFSGAVTGQAAP